ncbi:MAG: C1 family peptidase, partial [Dehalococcoidales bacterium]|nr:C1 family peptidase [Dehalococcoidales bacterium]
VRLDSRIVKVLNQGSCGTCVGQATAGIVSAGHNKELSPLYIYARCKQEDGIPNTEGTYPRVALKIAHSEGACQETMLPYSRLLSCLAFPAISQDMKEAASGHKIKAYARLNSFYEIKQALANGNMVLGGILVTSNFASWNGQGVFDVPEGNILGAHAITVCGYDDGMKALRCLNSWGEEWGDGGFFWLSYDFVNWKSDIGMLAWMEGWAVEIEHVNSKIELWIDKPIARINGAETMIDPANPKVVPLLIEGRTMLPARFISEAIGKRISWDAEEQKVTIEG